MAFVVRYALHELVQKSGRDAVIEMALAWDKTSRELNRHYIKGEGKGLWSSKVTLVHEFRKHVYQTLITFPIKDNNHIIPKKECINCEFLAFFPARIKDREGKEVEIIRYDAQNFSPVDLTDDGWDILSGILF